MMDLFDEILNEGLTLLKEDIIQASIDAGQKALGHTYKNINVYVSNNYGAISAPIYFYTLIRGRGAGKIPANFGDIIKKWADYKGITFGSLTDLNRFAYFVGKKMREEGSRLYRDNSYLDITDTPIQKFEEWLDNQIAGVADAAIKESIFPVWNN